ncbi:YcaO-like family protein [Candidatus Giovannonibacteria bacterium]|nr:YcaO-like family protein [Candidatus Giovannonibacteria bacterium]
MGKKLEITKKAEDFLKKPNKGGIFSIWPKFLLKNLEKYFGSELLVKIPDTLADKSQEMLVAIDTLYQLQSMGIIENIKKGRRYPDEPFIYIYNVNSNKESNIKLGTGVEFNNEVKAIWRATAEGVERSLWSSSDHLLKNSVESNYEDLKGKALNIFKLAGFSEEQKSNLSNLKFNTQTELRWLEAFSVQGNEKMYCPLQLASSNFAYRNQRLSPTQNRKEPLLRWCITTGLASGRNMVEAIVKGIMEVIERDAFMITYLNKLSPEVVDLDYVSAQDEEINAIIKNFQRYRLEPYIVRLPSDFPVHIYLAVILDRTGLGPAFCVGASADFDFKQAIIDSLSEALIVRYSLKRKFKNDINEKQIGREERLIYWSRPENLNKIEFIFSGEKVKIDLKKRMFELRETQEYFKEKLKILSDELSKKNYEACYVKITTPEIEKLGIFSAKVIISELQPMHLNESIPYFGGKRLKEIPEKMGYKAALTLNQEPHPFP